MMRSKIPGTSKLITNKSLWQRIIMNRTLYFFIMPAVIYLAIFNYAPMYGVVIAFKDFNGALGILGSKWVGLKHFKAFITSYNFVSILKNTFNLSMYSMVLGFPFPIIIALILNEVKNAKYKKFVQTVLYAPHFISTVVMAGLIIIVLSPSTGIVNFLLETLGAERKYFMTIPSYFKHIYVWSGIWQGTGWGAIIYLAALSSVNPELHEASTIDGASRIQRIQHINLPAIMPTITIILIMNIGSMVKVGFEKVYLLQNPLNSEVSEVISTYVYKRGLINGSFSFSSAVGLFNNIINLILLLIANFIARKFSETSLF